MCWCFIHYWIEKCTVKQWNPSKTCIPDTVSPRFLMQSMPLYHTLQPMFKTIHLWPRTNATDLEASLFFSFRVFGRTLNGNSLTGVMSFIIRPNLSSSLPILHNLRGLGVKSFPSPFLALPLKSYTTIMLWNCWYTHCT